MKSRISRRKLEKSKQWGHLEAKASVRLHEHEHRLWPASRQQLSLAAEDELEASEAGGEASLRLTDWNFSDACTTI